MVRTQVSHILHRVLDTCMRAAPATGARHPAAATSPAAAVRAVMLLLIPLHPQHPLSSPASMPLTSHHLVMQPHGAFPALLLFLLLLLLAAAAALLRATRRRQQVRPTRMAAATARPRRHLGAVRIALRERVRGQEDLWGQVRRPHIRR